MTQADNKPRMSLANVSDEPDRSPQATVLHGPPGIGKTSFVADAPGVVFLCSERGLKGVGSKRVPHFPYPTSLDDFGRALAELTTGQHDFRHVAIDSADWLEALIHRHVCFTNKKAHMEGEDFKKLYVAAVPYFEQLLQRLDALRDRRRMHVWIIAHSTQIKAANTDGEVWDKWDLKLDRRFAERLREWADNVFFADWVAQVVKSKGRRAVGKLRGRVLHTVESADHFAKNRNALPATLPLSFTALQSALVVGRPASDAKLRARLDALVEEPSPEDQESIREDLAHYQLENPRRLSIILSKAESLRALADDDELEHDGADDREPIEVDDDAPNDADDDARAPEVRGARPTAAGGAA